MSQTPATSQRLISLDALQGYTIALMVIVNDPGFLEPCVSASVGLRSGMVSR